MYTSPRIIFLAGVFVKGKAFDLFTALNIDCYFFNLEAVFQSPLSPIHPNQPFLELFHFLLWKRKGERKKEESPCHYYSLWPAGSEGGDSDSGLPVAIKKIVKRQKTHIAL